MAKKNGFPDLLSALLSEYETGESMVALAEQVGCSTSAIYKTLRGGGGIGWGTLTKILDLLSPSEADRADIEFAWVEWRSQSKAEGAAYVREMSKLAKYAPAKIVAQFKRDVVKVYVEELKARGML